MKEEQKQYNNVAPKSCYEKICRRNIDYTQLLDRTIVTNLPDPQLPNNKIQTSKYNYISFIPLNLAQQFTKPANIYFLFIGILQAIPAISLSQGKPTIFLPLSIVIIISMIKDFIEDRKRHKSDQKENQSEIELLTKIGFTGRRWEDLQVGNIIRVKKDSYFPCDIILLDHDKEQKNAFIQTKNLDGETNLKLKKTCERLQNLRQIAELDLQAVRIEFSFEKPNPFLSTFNGNVKISDKKFMVQNANVILRGCSLKINEWAIGLCTYTGHETKILLNSGSQKRKSSYLETILNQYFKGIFIFQILVTFLSALLYGIIYGLDKSIQGYLNQNDNVAFVTITTWGSWFVSFSAFIPIGLLVSVEIVRYGQGIKLGKDQLCKSKGQYTEVQTSNLNEQLGQVKYIMTDKTGTLTQNLMQFKCLYVNGEYFGSNQPISSKYQGIIDPQTSRQLKRQDQIGNLSDILQKNKILHVDFQLSQKIRILSLLQANSYQSQQIRKTLLHLSLCHNVISQNNTYSSSSPDELSLVSFAKFIGFEFTEKNDKNELIIQQKTHQRATHKYKLLHILDFTSERKRMSVIVEDLNSEEKTIFLITKGADQIIIPRTLRFQQSSNHPEISKIQEALHNYANQGLRTLVLAQKQIDRRTYEEWNDKYNEALAIIGQQRYAIIDKLQSDLQKQLILVGATAIEDKLQNQVKQTIRDLKKSNIKVWMLTGDKKQTAISIGHSCGLIDNQCETIALDCGAEHAKTLLNNLSSVMSYLKHKKVTIVSGQFIRTIDDESRIILEDILLDSESVICCRVSPKDKQYITEMVKKWGVTLAIGDGANDVNMIHCANVGVGVRGIQGSQATRAADYVITEFKLLKRLVIYHGLNFYHRNSNVMLYTLYKNMLLAFPNLFYGPISLQSATNVYQIWVIQFFNLFFVAIPIIYYGFFDILYSCNEVHLKPFLYQKGQNCHYFNKKILIKLLVQTLLISIFLIYTVFYAAELTPTAGGYMTYREWEGNLVFAIVVISCNIRIVLMSHQFNIIQGFFILFGIASYYLIYQIICAILYSDSKNTLSQQLSTGLYYLLIFFLCFVIEGINVVQTTIANLNKLINQAREEKNTERRPQSLPIRNNLQKQISNIHQHKELQVFDDGIQQKSQRGYAFAQDQNRFTFDVEQKASNIKKRLTVL